MANTCLRCFLKKTKKWLSGGHGMGGAMWCTVWGANGEGQGVRMERKHRNEERRGNMDESFCRVTILKYSYYIDVLYSA